MNHLGCCVSSGLGKFYDFAIEIEGLLMKFAAFSRASCDGNESSDPAVDRIYQGFRDGGFFLPHVGGTNPKKTKVMGTLRVPFQGDTGKTFSCREGFSSNLWVFLVVWVPVG